MSPEKQRIAIAEACGWKPEEVSYGTCWTRPTPPLCFARHPSMLPDYLNDLNAMHEAEKVLTDDGIGRRLFGGYLVSIVNGRLGHIYEPTHDEWHNSQRATAAQRAEALLRTLGKWEEGK